MIKVEKVNETFMRVFADDGIEQEMSQFFTFEVPGYRFMPAYKAGMFDGKIRLYDLRRKTLYVGLLEYLKIFAANSGYQVNIDPKFMVEPMPEQEIKEYVDWLDIHSRGNKLSVHDYQYNGITRVLQDNRRMLLSPTASGKSLMIYSTMRWHLDQGRKILILVPTTSLVEQMYADFIDYSSNNGWKTDRHCQKLYSGFSRDFESDVLISTWQSVYKQPQAWFNQFDVVFGDEAHLFKAKSLVSILEKMSDVKYRIGTTGTLDGSKVNKLVLEGLFGPVYKVTSTRELMDSGKVANLKIKCLILKYHDVTRQAMKGKKYQDEMDFLVGHPGRNKFIRNLSLSCEGNTLVLFQYVKKHGEVLYEMIRAKAHEDRKVFFIYGNTDTDVRESARHITDKENNAIIVASYGVFSTGVNIPSIENVIFASPTKSKIRNLQSIGRGLRLRDGKSTCKLFDVADDISWKSKSNHTLRHLKERVKIYSEEKFDFKLMEIEIEE